MSAPFLPVEGDKDAVIAKLQGALLEALELHSRDITTMTRIDACRRLTAVLWSTSAHGGGRVLEDRAPWDCVTGGAR